MPPGRRVRHHLAAGCRHAGGAQAGQISHAISSAWFDRFIEAYDREFDRFFANIEADRQPGGKEATAWDGYVANVVADAALDSLHHGGRIPVTLNEQPALYR